MDVTNDGILVASGEVGPKPWIFVWDIESKNVINKWNSPLEKGISAIGFNPNSSKLAAISIN